MNHLTLDQRKWILKSYWKFENANEVREHWRETFHTEPPSRQAIYALRDKFDTDGTVKNKEKSGRKRTTVTEENELVVALTFQQSPRKSTRRAALELSISRTSLRRLMAKLHLRPYRPRLLHGLLEDDPDRRIQCCETMRDMIANEDEDFLNKIVWSDEACFKLSGRVNRHNCVYWTAQNPHEVLQKQQKDPGVVVWGGISSDGLIGPFFFDGTVNGANYLEMLETYAVPQLRHIWEMNSKKCISCKTAPRLTMPCK